MTLPFDLAVIEKLTPEQYAEFLVRMARELPRDVLVEQRKQILRIKAGEADNFDNYLAYHELIHNAPLEQHDYDAVKESFEAHLAGEMFLWLGFRGCLKTTTELTIDSFLIGHHPDGTGIITGASDDNAVTNAKFVAQIIDLHPEYKQIFPYVVVDKPKGWGADGYWVRLTHEVVNGELREISEGEWKQRQSKVIDPTFVGGGYKSSRINGRHPSLFLSVDDLHDIDTSASVAEREYIKQVFFTQILKTIIRRKDKLVTRVDVTGVPFSKDDAYAQLQQMGGTRVVVLPVMKRAAEGEGVYIDGVNPKTGAVYEDIVGWWHLTWPENFGVASIINARSEGKGPFWQMFMLDIQMARTQGLMYYLYPHNDIGFDLPTAGGADPTSVDPDYEVGGQKRSSFALAYVCKLVKGGLVLKDGFLKAVGFMGAKNAILQAQTMFRNWSTTGVEDVGVGKAFMQFLRLFQDVRFIDSNIIDPKGKIKDKRTRIEAELSPWLENGVLKISDEETEYNRAVRYGLDNFFDLDFAKPHASIDALDGLYHAVKRFPEVLREYALDSIDPEEIRAGQQGGLWHPLFGGQPPGVKHGR